VIEINLLPKTLRKKKRKKLDLPKMPKIDVKFMPIAIGIVAALVGIQLLLNITLAVKKRSLKKLDAKWVIIEPKRKEMLAIKKEVHKYKDKIAKIGTLSGDRILWAKKLNDMSDSMVHRIWLTSVSLERFSGRQLLSIKGNASSFGEDEAAIVGRFMKALKENKSFFNDFDEIELGTIQQKKLKGVEVMDFSIKCYFKKNRE